MVNQERLNINTATEEELMTLPGVNRPVARSIVEYRDCTGGFKKHSPSSLRRDPEHMSFCSGMNINTAVPPQLMSIRGITEKIARNIVAYRTQHGPFKSIEDLVRVDHINRSLLDKIRFQVFVERSRTPSTNTNGGLTYTGRSHPSPTSFSLRSDDLDLPPGGPTQMASLRPREAPAPGPRDSRATVRLATWDLQRCSSEKANNPGVKEVVWPLSTAAGVYHDLTGQRVEVLWQKAVSGWAARLAQVLPPLLDNPQLRPLAQATLATMGTALDVAGQQTFLWVESKLTAALSGVRSRLASVYQLSPSDCSVSVAIPLPRVSWARMAESGLVEILLEEWLLRPLKAFTSIRPNLEFYRLKHRVMDSPFRYQALLVANQYVVSFDGLLFQLPAWSCPVVLAQDRSQNPTFTLLLSPRRQSHHGLLLDMNHSTLNIYPDGQVKTSCPPAATPYREPLVAIQRTAHTVEVSNQNGVSVSCDLLLDVCSLTLDGWLHGTTVGLLGTNDNEAGNEMTLPNGSRAASRAHFLRSWQVSSNCSRAEGPLEECSGAAMQGPAGCHALFSSAHSPLSSCFRVFEACLEIK
ncbi:endonuclease/exonuclease/phosphatase family domain-containing protein 1-like [Gadus chalcogrammus]|uniref:endonuclease/exonuclease/phosphatase family domain-containing protein 1-like n=1 Tax=Gadus chalcogrammus TaxID=1042646 RepID=UPI0024C4C73E|nr:endonuclease/exonuclease/phosphatase family domain-containing protein 1-like [Gadus chalcogrammus]